MFPAIESDDVGDTLRPVVSLFVQLNGFFLDFLELVKDILQHVLIELGGRARVELAHLSKLFGRVVTGYVVLLRLLIKQLRRHLWSDGLGLACRSNKLGVVVGIIDNLVQHLTVLDRICFLGRRMSKTLQNLLTRCVRSGLQRNCLDVLNPAALRLVHDDGVAVQNFQSVVNCQLVYGSEVFNRRMHVVRLTGKPVDKVPPCAACSQRGL